MNLAAGRKVPLGRLLAGMAHVSGTADPDITGLSGDSRCVSPGDLFLATRGLTHHGLEFLDAVTHAGAAAVAWEPPYRELYQAPLPMVPIEGLSHKAGTIAGRFYGEPSRHLSLVGVTGTDGKTSCTHFIAQSLSVEGRRCGLLGTLGYGVFGDLNAGEHTTPDAITVQQLLARMRLQGVGNAAMEVSSHALAQGRVSGLRFRVAVLTNVTRDHLDYHGDLETYSAAKARLFLDYVPEVAVLNLDDAFGRGLVDRLTEATRVVGYGLEPQSRNRLKEYVWGEDLSFEPNGLNLRVVSAWGEGRLHTGLLGRFNASNVLATLATLLALDVSFDDALIRLADVSAVPGRMERFEAGGDCPVAVVDYAHTPYALEQVLQALREHQCGKIWCVFGCGGDRDPGKRPLMGRIAERLADELIVTDDNPRTEDPQKIYEAILAGAERPSQIAVVPGRRDAIIHALSLAAAGDTVIIAGKGHEDYQIVGTERLPFSDQAVVRHWMESQA